MLVLSTRKAVLADAFNRRILGPFFQPGVSPGRTGLAGSYTEARARGALTIVDSASVLSVSGGVLTPGAASTNPNDPIVRDPTGIARQAGRALLFDFNPKSTWWNNGYTLGLGFQQTAGSGSTSNLYGWLIGLSNTTALGYILGQGTASRALTLDAWASHAVILRTAGLFLVKDGKLQWVEASGADTTLYQTAFCRDAASASPYLRNLRVSDLGGPWSGDYGIATQRLAGAQTAGTSFSHTADCHVEFVCTTRPTSGSIIVLIRQQDATNYWSISVGSNGLFSISEIVNGTPTVRASAAAAVSSGNRVVVIAEGTAITGFVNGVQKWTYGSASNFATATAGHVNALGTGGALSDLVSWPLSLSGAALLALLVG